MKLNFSRAISLKRLKSLRHLAFGSVLIFVGSAVGQTQSALSSPLPPVQASSTEFSPSLIDQAIAQEQAQLTLATLPTDWVATPEPAPQPARVERDLTVAAVTAPPPVLPVPVQAAPSALDSEDLLIQQLSGKTPTPSRATTGATLPVVALPPLSPGAVPGVALPPPPEAPQLPSFALPTPGFASTPDQVPLPVPAPAAMPSVTPSVTSPLPPIASPVYQAAQPPDSVLIAAGLHTDVGLGWLISEGHVALNCQGSLACDVAEPGMRFDPSVPTVRQVAQAQSSFSAAEFLREDEFLGQNPDSLPFDIDPRQQPPTPIRRAASPATLQFQGVYIHQGDVSSARARVSGTYPLSPRLLFGATVDLTTGNAFADSQQQGLSLNELYFATSLEDVPNLRFVVGQLDLTSYFDRNSFAKDAATHFFNPAFQTNPALTATGIASRPGLLANWSVNDNLEAKAAIFSSSRSLGNFSLDGFAGEVGYRAGNAIIRGTYASGRDGGNRGGFGEIFQIARGGGVTGPLESDRVESYGVNAEVFIPNLRMGIFGRYGRYNNLALAEGGDTYSAGVNFLDVFSPNDRLGLAYGRLLSNDRLRRQAGAPVPDVLEVFYDAPLLPNLRVGFSLQQLNGFSETVAGVRLRTDFDLVSPQNRQLQ